MGGFSYAGFNGGYYLVVVWLWHKRWMRRDSNDGKIAVLMGGFGYIGSNNDIPVFNCGYVFSCWQVLGNHRKCGVFDMALIVVILVVVCITTNKVSWYTRCMNYGFNYGTNVVLIGSFGYKVFNGGYMLILMAFFLYSGCLTWHKWWIGRISNNRNAITTSGFGYIGFNGDYILVLNFTCKVVSLWDN